VKPDSSRAETAYVELRKGITDGTFLPGDRMREADLAERLGISRTPVREALRRLESEGLVTGAHRHTGLIVSTLDQSQVSEIYAVRDVLEGLAARLAAQHASEAEISTMKDLLRAQEQVPESQQGELAELNELFHRVIYSGARNRYLTSALESFESSLALLPGTTYASKGRAESALSEHHELVDAIAAHDPDRAEKIARGHMREAERLRLTMLTQSQTGIGRMTEAGRR
jgi:DNA-binding GntR family transcriptional regulator